jgi:hypothetical protein
MADTVYNYIRVPLTTKMTRSVKKDGEAVICVRIQRPLKNSKAPYKYLVSFSFCSTNDNFSKSIGRDICDKRVGLKKTIEVSHNEKLSTKAVTDIAVNMLKVMKHHKQNVGFNLPAWF